MARRREVGHRGSRGGNGRGGRGGNKGEHKGEGADEPADDEPADAALERVVARLRNAVGSVELSGGGGGDAEPGGGGGGGWHGPGTSKHVRRLAPYMQQGDVAARFDMAAFDPGTNNVFAIGSVRDGPPVTWVHNHATRAHDEGHEKNRQLAKERACAERLAHAPLPNGAHLTIAEHLSALERPRSSRLSVYSAYVQRQLDFDSLTREHFNHPRYLSDRLTKAIGQQRAKNLMVASFRKTFGGPHEVAIAFGSWNKSHNAWYVAAFIEAGYIVLYIDEHLTTKRCSRPGCCGTCERFLLREDGELAWKTIRCDRCGIIYMRDFNAARNIRTIALALQCFAQRPEKLARTTEYDTDGTDSCF